MEARRIESDTWRFEHHEVPGREYATVRHAIVTPRKTLTLELQSNEYTAWVSERLLKDKSDIDLIAEFAPQPLCDVAAVNRHAAKYGDRALVRGHLPCFDLYGQPGCWQDACVLYGVEEMIMETFDDPQWVHAFLGILRDRKVRYADSLQGAHYDVLEHGGGDASSTVISPKVFDEFVAPYDRAVIAHARAAGQRIVYHTCGGMMPLLERLVTLGSNALETFTPPAMGGDMNLAEAKRRIGDQVCFIGGFDQNRFFTTATPEETRAEVRRCFREAGGGGLILSPSDHFFEAKPELLHAFADEAQRCTY
jgi:uroporphyrinogen-III decarboxylase